ncbi:hypothetical protein [Croceicoccus sp. Ery5]|uniref:hypothetical protein n=1 Tax=Croceicoccus sp. Ery5 TaxID=1703340 RepID=UPI001E4E150C|nr:hypothetical protein [Croceicoccus sp. Ery5]
MGLAVYPVEVNAQVLNELEGAGLIADRDITDKDKVASALHRALTIWANENFTSRVTRIARGKR